MTNPLARDLDHVRVRTGARNGVRLELWQWAVILGAAAAFCTKLVLALKTYGSNDVYTLEEFLVAWRYLGTDLYRVGAPNNPPSMLYLWAFLRGLAHLTGLPFSFWFKAPAILADLGSLWLVWRMLRSRLGERSIRWSLFLMAVAPASVLISGFHGQNDSVMIFFLLLAAYLVEKGRTLAGGAAFGLSLCVKVAPIIAIPVLVFYQFGRKKWVAFFAATVGVLLIAWSPFIISDPLAVLRDLLGYKSGLGHWGISYLAYQLSLLSPVGTSLCAVIEKFGSPILLLAIAVLSWRMNRSANKPLLYFQIGLVFFLFLAGTNGFGVQYLAWLVPFAAGLGAAPAALFYATSGVFLFLVYEFWCQGMPWYLADSIRLADYYFAGLDYFHVLCWLSVVALAWTCWRQIRGLDDWQLAIARLAPARRHLAVALASLLLLVPAALWFRSPHAVWIANWPRGAPALTIARRWYLQDLSVYLRRVGRLQASDEVAARARAADLSAMY
jgi:hypothetical protein